jgi:hypothetical protein
MYEIMNAVNQLWKRVFILLLVIVVGIIIPAKHLQAATGTLSGRILDEKSGDPLIGANVILDGTEYGSATDMDGSFVIPKVPEGSYNLIVSYVGYETQKVTDIKILPNRNEQIGIALKASVMGLEEVVVEVAANRTSESFLLTEKKNSVNVQDAISSEQIGKSGDSNAADAMRRVTGVSVLDGKYVYVRGLGHRYTTAQMNNAPVPSPEPERRTVPLNLFPAEILESVSAFKTFTPDLPGAFAGGSVNIRTKAYPDNRMIKFSASVSDNSYLYDNIRFAVGGHGKNDFWGYDDGSRNLPAALPKDEKVILYNNEADPDLWSNKLGEINRAFKSDLMAEYYTPSKPFSVTATLGNRFSKSSNFEYGYYLNANFGNKYKYQQESYNHYSLTGDTLAATTYLLHNKSSYNTNKSLSFSTGFKALNNHKIKFYNLYTHTSEDKYIYSEGKTDNVDDGAYIKTRYVEKSILNSTLTGQHLFEGFGKHRLDWSLNYGVSDLYEPDDQSHIYRWKGNRGRYELDTKSSEPKRIYTFGNDQNGNIDLNYAYEIKDRFGDSYKLKTGSRIQRKERSFEKRNLMYVLAPGTPVAKQRDLIWLYPDSATGQATFGYAFLDSNLFCVDADGVKHYGMQIIDDPGDGGNKSAYDADETLDAFYAMIEMPLTLSRFSFMKNIQFIGGFRLESYKLNLYPYDTVTKAPFENNFGDTIVSRIDEADFLPSYNLVVSLPKDIKLRLSYSETVARAEFREIAPFEYQEFYGGQYSVGYPFLKTTDIRNLDLRMEWYRKAGELLAMGVFHKDFNNPIEVALLQPGERIYRSFTNAPSAKAYGLEVETRIGLPFVPITFGYGQIMANATFGKSEVEMQEQFAIFTGDTITNSAANLQRSMQGHSDFMFNAAINFNTIKGFEINLAYNTFSRRLASLGVGRLDDEYEYPFHSLNLTTSKKINRFKISFKANNLLNSDVTYGVMEESTDKMKETRKWSPGLSFSLGLSANL